jgi:hypothetical protein
MKTSLRWALLGVVLLTVIGIIVLRYSGPTYSPNEPALASTDQTQPNVASAALPRLLQLRGGAD